MKNLRKVKLARLMDAVQVVGYGQVGGGGTAVEPRAAVGTKPSLALFLTPCENLLLRVGTVEVIVTSARVNSMVLGPEEEAPRPSNKAK